MLHSWLLHLMYSWCCVAKNIDTDGRFFHDFFDQSHQSHHYFNSFAKKKKKKKKKKNKNNNNNTNNNLSISSVHLFNLQLKYYFTVF